jgi:hypothetical protein
MASINMGCELIGKKEIPIVIEILLVVYHSIRLVVMKSINPKCIYLIGASLFVHGIFYAI